MTRSIVVVQPAYLNFHADIDEILAQGCDVLRSF